VKKCLLVVFVTLLFGVAEVLYLGHLIGVLNIRTVDNSTAITKVSKALLLTTKHVTANREAYLYGKK
jgi:hypothetical protein